MSRTLPPDPVAVTAGLLDSPRNHTTPRSRPALPFLVAGWDRGMAPSPAQTATGVRLPDRGAAGRTVPGQVPTSVRPGRALAAAAARSPGARCRGIRHARERHLAILDRKYRRIPDRGNLGIGYRRSRDLRDRSVAPRGRLVPSAAAAAETARCPLDGPTRMGSRPRSDIHREHPRMRYLVRLEPRGVSRVFSLSSWEDLYLQLAILQRGPYWRFIHRRSSQCARS